jgi:hypothetical protein
VDGGPNPDVPRGIVVLDELLVGTSLPGAGDRFSGVLDELHFFARALTSQEIVGIATASGGLCP